MITVFPPSPKYYTSPLNVDVNRNVDWFVAMSKAWVPWLADNVAIDIATNIVTADSSKGSRVFPVDPGNLYDGSQPYLVWTAPRYSDTGRESGETGNIKNEPNTYVGVYRECAFSDSDDTMLEQRRVLDTYSILTSHLKPNDPTNAPCPPTGVSITSISYEHEWPSVFIQTPSGLYVGAIIIVRVEERYPDGPP
jgi:hypothetical protein